MNKLDQNKTPEEQESLREHRRKKQAAYRAANPEPSREAARRWRAKNIERAREAARQYRAADPEKARDRSREWRAADPERARAAVRKYRANNLEAERVRSLQWRAANPEKERARSRAKRQRRYASCKTSTAEAPTTAQLKALLKKPCHYCGARAEHVDHYIPLARGGTHTLDNLRPACAPCNQSKHAKMPWDWRGR